MMKLQTFRRKVAWTATLGCAAMLWSGVSHAAEAGTCPLGRTMATTEGKLCAYVAVIAPINTHMAGKNLLNLPADIVVRLFQAATGPIGAIIAGAYFEEGNRRYGVKLSTPNDSYVFRRAHTLHESVSGANFEEWSPVGNTSATFRYGLEQKDIFKGSSWFGGAAIGLAQHRDYVAPPRELDEALNAVLSAVQADLNEAASLRRAKEAREAAELRPPRYELSPRAR